jgi:hypothetical protein
MIKSSLLVSVAFLTGAVVSNASQAPTRLSACDVDSRSEAIIWANQNPTVGYRAACQGLSGS